MSFKKIISELNILRQCRKHNLTAWQCPQFLFLIMGIIIIFSIIIIYTIGRNYIEDPLLISLIVLIISVILFVISIIIIRSFEKMVEVSKMKSEFVRIISHQLRSPLSNLKWVIEMLMSKRVPSVSEKQLEYLLLLKENNKKMIDLVSDLLLVSKIQDGRMVFKKENFSLDELVRKTLEELKFFIKAFNVNVIFNSEKNMPEVMADPVQIRIVFKNLLDNAIRYVKERGKIEINLKKEKNYLYLQIKDNGVGIPKDEQKYIFQRFFRSKNAINHQVGGSGLSLYITKSIIKESGGEIGFKSQEGKGSTFWFTLPIFTK